MNTRDSILQMKKKCIQSWKCYEFPSDHFIRTSKNYFPFVYDAFDLSLKTLSIFFVINYSPTGCGILEIFIVFCFTFGKGMVRITPALVPIHRSSLQANKDVTRRQAALCCLIISSVPTSLIYYYIFSKKHMY